MGTSHSVKKLKWMYERMTLIRYFEERVDLQFRSGRLPGVVHLYAGEEAVAVGVCARLRAHDYITSTHRPHGHAIAKGVSVKSLMAELYGKVTGCCRGKGGSMHITDIDKGMLSANGIVAAGLPLACGAALSAKYRKTDQIAVAFLGDGATNSGAFGESLNFAAVFRLPVIFVIENNSYADATRIQYAAAVERLSLRSQGYGVAGDTIDGMDIFNVYHAVGDAVKRARQCKPSLLECKTYRYFGHMSGDQGTYRSKVEVEEYKKKDCIRAFEKRVVEEGWLAGEELAQIRTKSVEMVEDAVRFAEKSAFPSCDELLTDVYVHY